MRTWIIAALAAAATPAYATTPMTCSNKDVTSCGRLVAILDAHVDICGGTLSPDPRGEFAMILIAGGGMYAVETARKDIQDTVKRYGKDGVCKQAAAILGATKAP